jgi:hypothetical protein
VSFVGGFKRQNNSTTSASIAASTAMNSTISYTIIDIASADAVNLAAAITALAATILFM